MALRKVGDSSRLKRTLSGFGRGVGKATTLQALLGGQGEDEAFPVGDNPFPFPEGGSPDPDSDLFGLSPEADFQGAPPPELGVNPIDLEELKRLIAELVNVGKIPNGPA